MLPSRVFSDGKCQRRGVEPTGSLDANSSLLDGQVRKNEVRRDIIGQINFFGEGLTQEEMRLAVGPAPISSENSARVATRGKVEGGVDDLPQPAPVMQLPRLAHPTAHNGMIFYYCHTEEQRIPLGYQAEE